MSSFADDFRDSVFADMQDVFGVTGDYVRGVTTVSNVVALSSSEAASVEDQSSFGLDVRHVMFRIAADALGVLDRPRRGDRFTVDSVVHEVLPNDGEPEWSYSADNRSEIVFRAKVVSE